MAKKKRYRGHFCKKCAKKPKEQQSEEIALNRIYHVYQYQNLSRDNRRMLENYSHSKIERIRSAALEAIATFRKGPLSEGIECSDEDFLEEVKRK